jgi:hypothetical protein
MTMQTENPRPVLVISDAKWGDFQNVLALGTEIANKIGAPVQVIDLHARASILSSPLNVALRVAQNRGFIRSKNVRNVVQFLFFRGNVPVHVCPVAVVSTLGRGEAQGAFVGSFWQVPAIHLGRLKRMRQEFFSAVIAHAGDESAPSEFSLPIAPTRMASLSRNGRAASGAIARVCLLLGGNAGDVIEYPPTFWVRCLDLAAVTASFHRANVSVITSPRTGRDVEQLIDEAAGENPEMIDRLILFGQGSQQDIRPEIAAADLIFVTAESISMMSDALASGARVVAVYNGQMPTSSRVQSFLRQHTEEKTLHLLNLSEWDGTVPPLEDIKPSEVSWPELLWRDVSPLFEG